MAFLLKNRLFFILLGGVIALLFLLHVISPAFASTLTAHMAVAGTGMFSVLPGPPGPPPQLDQQQNNQIFHGITNANNHAHLFGSNQGNSGNPGFNRGDNQDSSVNGGNGISSQHKTIGTQQNNQFIQGDGASNSGNSASFLGVNQGNSGNEGINQGNNQDNSANAGNQVNNQSNVIGTQINNQGSSVNNEGNIIKSQVNYVNLVPGLGVYLGVQPRLVVALRVGN